MPVDNAATCFNSKITSNATNKATINAADKAIVNTTNKATVNAPDIKLPGTQPRNSP